MFRRILVPVDGSTTSARGLNVAIDLAKEQNAQLRLIHVVDERSAFAPPEAAGGMEKIVEAIKHNGEAVLERAKRTAEERGVPAATAMYESVTGPAAAAIIDEAADWHADVIVMGTHGRRGIRRLVLGSDAEQVLRNTPVPVLLVRASGDDAK